MDLAAVLNAALPTEGVRSMARSSVRPSTRPSIAILLGLLLASGAAAVLTANDTPSAAAAEPSDLPTDPARPDESELKSAADLDYVAEIQVVRGPAADPDTVTGTVFHDRNMDGIQQTQREPGIEGVAVSNGREVVETDSAGAYALPAMDDMSVFVTKPANYAVPLDEDGIPQMSYQHKPAGSPELRYGGLKPTGPLPKAINFPMVPTAVSEQFDCAIMGDTQPYSNNEVGYVRDTIATDLVGRDLSDTECMLILGDVVGDDLSLLPRFKDMMGVIDLPQYYIYGNHDMDWDAENDADAGDTWRREYGPTYYSFDIGQVHFVALDNLVYPCTEEDTPPNCGNPNSPAYAGRVVDQQMQWLANDLARVPEDKLIVLNHHVPLVSFIDNAQLPHQTSNVNDIYELLEGRPALDLSGHTHTLEQLVEGESYAGWKDAVGVDEVPFQHIVAGAPSGAWWSGELDINGLPQSISRLGEPRGYHMFEFDGADYVDTFYGSGLDPELQMWLSFNTPQFRQWFNKLRAWTDSNPPTTDQVPPVNVHDLADIKLFTPSDLAKGVYLSANVWNSTKDSEVTVSVDDGEPMTLTRTQAGEGEEVHFGVDYTDPFSAIRQLQIARTAFQSTSGNERAQGYETGQASKFGPGVPQSGPTSYIAEKSSHLWRLKMPTDLELGTHVARIQFVDRYGQSFTDEIVFEVREKRPFRFWRNGPWEDETARERTARLGGPSGLLR
jgi:C terminal of Calcineurin-like phosphoesterase/N terminal of Calcineurin-like phosphoesterase/Calcineurin-like phosphoesterase